MFALSVRPDRQNFRMDKRFLGDCLGRGMSLSQIGELAGKDPSTVGYWVQKHGLKANGAEKYAPRGGLRRDALEALVDRKLTLEEMSRELDRSVSTVRHWLRKFSLQPTRGGRRRKTTIGPRLAVFECRHHGRTEFVLEGSGYYRCKRCRGDAVARRRRVVKQTLVEEAGGACVVCGYSRWLGALQFHHVDPGSKEFHLAQRGHSRSIARSRAEIRKCVLLCANCHAEVEGGFATLPVDFESPSQRSSG
jgi:DNA-binding transcriptional ArsR family regulator